MQIKPNCLINIDLLFKLCLLVCIYHKKYIKKFFKIARNSFKYDFSLVKSFLLQRKSLSEELGLIF